MKAVFFVLLAVNLLFLAWAQWIDTPREPGSEEGLSRLPKLQLVTEAPAAPKPAANAEKMAFRDPEPTSRCASVGPFNDIVGAARAAGTLSEHGFKPQQRAEQGETIEGYWVFVGGMQTDEAVDAVVQKLGRAGFTDAHVMKPSTQGHRVSVGLFSQRERAERRAVAVQHMGLAPQIAERTFPGTVYWVDVEVRPGQRDLSQMGLWEQAEHVSVRAQACPPGPAVQPVETLAPDTGEESDGVTRALPRTTVASAPTPR